MRDRVKTTFIPLRALEGNEGRSGTRVGERAKGRVLPPNECELCREGFSGRIQLFFRFWPQSSPIDMSLFLLRPSPCGATQEVSLAVGFGRSQASPATLGVDRINPPHRNEY